MHGIGDLLADLLRDIAARHPDWAGGVPDDLPLEEFDCSVCRDARMVKKGRGGPLVPCPRCVPPERTEERKARYQRLSRLEEYPALRRMTFATFDTEWPGVAGEQRELRAIRDEVRAWAHQPDGFLLLNGDNRSGKTHLAAAVVHERVVFGLPAVFVIVPDLLEDMRREYGDGGGDDGDAPLLDLARRAPLLVMDDIGAARMTDWAAERLFLLVNARLLADLPTLITSDLEVGAWERPELRRLRARIVGARKLATGRPYGSTVRPRRHAGARR